MARKAVKNIKLEDIVTVEVNEELLNEFISNIDVLPNTREVVKQYEAEIERLEEREDYLKKQREDFLEQQFKLMQEMDVNKDNISEYIYTKKLYMENVKEIGIVDALLDEMKEEYKEVRLKYFPLFAKAESADRPHQNHNANPLVKKVLAETMEVIARAGKEVKNQYYSVSPVLNEFKEDNDVLEAFPRVRYIYNPALFEIRYSDEMGYGGVELTRSHVNTACNGNVPDHLKK